MLVVRFYCSDSLTCVVCVCLLCYAYAVYLCLFVPPPVCLSVGVVFLVTRFVFFV